MYKRLGDGLFGEVGKDIVVSCCWSPDDILRFSLSSVRSDGGFLLREKNEMRLLGYQVEI